MSLIVQKYGGSSLATPKHIRRAAARVRDLKRTGRDVVVVVSAMGNMTDHLILLARRTVKRPPQRELDMLLTAGERVSMALLAMALHEEGIPAISFTGSQSGIVTSTDHTEARILAIRGHRISEELGRGRVVIIAGFQGVSEAKEVTTLGRGGSDTTAVALAAVLSAECCEILTDVNGLFSADPRLVPEARLLPACHYDEALELASLGAKMHSRSIEVAKRFKVKLRIGSSQEPSALGTWIQSAGETGGAVEEVSIRGVTTRDGYHFFRATLPIQTLLPLLRHRKIHIRCFSATAQEVQFVCEQTKAADVKDALLETGAVFEELSPVALISAVGEGLSTAPDILPDFVEALEETGVKPLLLSANSFSVTAAITSAVKERAARAVHRRLVERG